MDALIPHQPCMADVGLVRCPGAHKDREGYPDYQTQKTGKRIELKLLYVDNPALRMKPISTTREPSARLSQKVTLKNVNPSLDAMMLVAYRLEPQPTHLERASPKIVDIAVFSMIELIEARDRRLVGLNGRWFGDYEVPAVLSRIGRQKLKGNIALSETYGRMESEGKDYNEDTNFGKLRRIPHAPLQAFLDKHRISKAASIGPSVVKVKRESAKDLAAGDDQD